LGSEGIGSFLNSAEETRFLGGGVNKMSVKVRFAFPYRKLVGKEEVELDLHSPTKVRDILRMVSEKYPGFKDYAEKATDEKIATHMVILLHDRVLRLDDSVEAGQAIQIMPPVAGG
jgi:molybdopterin converting factor small subunit